MTLPFPFQTIIAVAPDDPIISSWGEAVRKESANAIDWIGKDFKAGAIANHNHNNLNSAGISVSGNFTNLSTTVRKVTDTTPTTTANWTTVSIAADTGGATAGLAFLQLRFQIDTTDTTNVTIQLGVRKNGDTPVHFPHVISRIPISSGGGTKKMGAAGFVIVHLDGSEQFQYTFDQGGSGLTALSPSATIDLLGFAA